MKVFIAYSRKDKKAMNQIRTEESNLGHDVFVDETMARNSPDWQKTIEEYIEDCDETIVLLSPTAKNSHHVRNEIAYAKLQQKDIRVMLVCGEIKSAVPLQLSVNNLIDRRKEFQ